MRKCLLAVLALALLAATPAASSDGGPSPGAITGWDGVVSPTGHVRYIALTTGRSTTVAAVEVNGGRVLNYRTLRGLYGIPLVANDGTTGGLSADATTLVLGPFGTPLQAGQVSRFAVVTPDKFFKVRRIVTLRGA